MKSFYGSSICHMLMINSRSTEQHSPNLPDPWSRFIISTSKDTLVSVVSIHSLFCLNVIISMRVTVDKSLNYFQLNGNV